MSFLVGTPNTLSIFSAASQTAAANPGGTTSTTAVMMGLNGSITPVITGRVLLRIEGNITNATSTDGATVQASYGTGTAPTNAASLTGTQVGSLKRFITGAATQTVPFSCTALITGLVLGTAVWLDAAVAAVTGGTATITSVVITAVEV